MDRKLNRRQIVKAGAASGAIFGIASVCGCYYQAESLQHPTLKIWDHHQESLFSAIRDFLQEKLKERFDWNTHLAVKEVILVILNRHKKEWYSEAELIFEIVEDPEFIRIARMLNLIQGTGPLEFSIAS